MKRSNMLQEAIPALAAALIVLMLPYATMAWGDDYSAPVAVASDWEGPAATAALDGEITYDLELSGQVFHQGDQFTLTRVATSTFSDTVPVCEFLGLFLNGQLFWWPNWSLEFTCVQWDISPGSHESLILDFIWPFPPSGMTAMFIGGLIDPDTWQLYDWDMVLFSW